MPWLAYGARELAHVADVFKGIAAFAVLTDLAGPGMELMRHIQGGSGTSSVDIRFGQFRIDHLLVGAAGTGIGPG